MLLSWSFVTLLAAVPMLASVIPPRATNGTVIPLSKRAHSFLDDQGVVNPDALNLHRKRAFKYVPENDMMSQSHGD